MFHPALVRQELWVREEYAAGFRARLAEIANSEAAHACWRCGWDDADTELLESTRHRQAMEEGKEDGYAGTRRLLFDAGQSARENSVPFDEARTAPWKQGWIAADIRIGDGAAV